MPETPGIRRPRHECHFGFNPFQSRLRALDERFEFAVGPVLIASIFGIVEVIFGYRFSRIGLVVLAAMFAITDATVVEAIETERIDFGMFRQYLRQNRDEEVAVGAE